MDKVENLPTFFLLRSTTTFLGVLGVLGLFVLVVVRHSGTNLTEQVTSRRPLFGSRKQMTRQDSTRLVRRNKIVVDYSGLFCFVAGIVLMLHSHWLTKIVHKRIEFESDHRRTTTNLMA